MDLKAIFGEAENGTLSYEAFEKALTAKGIKLADLSEGGYVSKQKYNDDIASKTTQIEGLNETITKRDTDLADLKSKLESAGVDSSKLAQITGELTELQDKYTAETSALQAKLDSQAYEFAAREFVNTKQFTSNAAKRDFSRALLEANLTMKDGKILGTNDFVKQYTKDNEDAFVKEPDSDPDPAPQPDPQPHFVQPTQQNPAAGSEPNPFASAFVFTGVRPHEKQ